MQNVCRASGLVVILSSLLSAQQAARHFELRAESPAFWELVDHDTPLTQVATGFGFTEGPVWDSRGFLYVSDETLNKIFRVFPDGRKETLIELGDPDGNTFDREQRLIDCASVLRAIIRVDPDGRYKVVADRFHGKRFNSPNDVVLGPDDAFYFTDPDMDLPKGEKRELPYHGVFRLSSRGDVRLLAKDITEPNGLAFSPDGQRLYVDDDSDGRNIWVYDFKPGGHLSRKRLFGREPGAEGDGVPDGMRFDAQGNLYVTGPLGVWVWDAQGQHLGTIVTPEQPANLAWGDDDYQTLYLTAMTSVYKLRTRQQGFVPYLPVRR